VSQPPRQQAYWRGDHADPEGPGPVTCGVFLLVAILLGALACWLLLKSQGLF
jgi:hypothetical protein